MAVNNETRVIFFLFFLSLITIFTAEAQKRRNEVGFLTTNTHECTRIEFVLIRVDSWF